jgi:hypothetical protein
MPRQKVVNGIYYDLTEAEEAELAERVAAADLDLSMVRGKRDGMLRESDWTQLPGGPLTDEQKEAWDTYRDELRDLPSVYSRVSDVIWPNDPPTQAAIDAAE